MPGPGGGSRGGGFGRSGGGGGFGGGPRPGGFGGGHRPGGFHRPPHHHHHHHYRPFFGFRYPFFGYGYGGGCLGGMMGMFLLPVILIFIVLSLVISIFGSIGSSITNVANGGQFVVNDQKMEDYANRHYAAEFSDAVEYEDNILIVFLVDENREDFYTMALVGYNVKDEINNMFGGKYTAYGQEMLENLNPNYENSLSRNLAATVRGLSDRIVNLRLGSSFIKDKGSPGSFESKVKNYSNLSVNAETLNDALVAFTEQTDIPIVIVIDDMEAVFDKSVNGADIATIIVAVIIAGAAIYFIIKSVKGKDDNDNGYRKEKETSDDDKDNSTSW